MNPLEKIESKMSLRFVFIVIYKQLSADIKNKIIKTSFLSPKRPKASASKMDINLYDNIRGKLL